MLDGHDEKKYAIPQVALHQKAELETLPPLLPVGHDNVYP